MLPVARITDHHICPMIDGLKPHFGGPVLPPGAPSVLAGGLPVATVGNPCFCAGPPDVIVTGAPKVLVKGRLVARVTDMTAHGGVIATGAANVLITPGMGGAMAQVGAASAALSFGEGVSGKADRLKERMALIAKGHKSSDPKQKAAAERLGKNNVAVERARLSQNVYDVANTAPGSPPPQAPPGWRNISADREALAQYNLTPSDLRTASGFQAAVYEPDPKVFGADAKPVVAFKGTSSGSDWKNNINQGLNRESEYYARATNVGRKVGRSRQSVDMTGHSLGGGLASAASTASGHPGWTFNAAGLHPKTVPRYLNSPDARPIDASRIEAYRVENELLTGVQEQGVKGTLGAAAVGLAIGGPVGAAIGALGKLLVSGSMPGAVGSPHTVPGSGDPYSRHGMDQVIDGIEQQKRDDQATLA
jgi:uncharacterized Zn-binding protein involved in type VI secretion